MKYQNPALIQKFIAGRRQVWQRVARGMDNFDLAVEHGKEFLYLSDDFSSWVTKLENEIKKWRAVLRHSRYLAGSIPSLESMDGKGLNPGLNNFPATVGKKTDLYFEYALKTDLEHINWVKIAQDSSKFLMSSIKFEIPEKARKLALWGIQKGNILILAKTRLISGMGSGMIEKWAYRNFGTDYILLLQYPHLCYRSPP